MFLITVEGGDGAGKSTLISHIRKALEDRKVPALFTREPGGSPLAEEIRDLLLKPRTSPEDHLLPLAELLLFEAARVEHVHKVIKPALNKGQVVVCDRFIHSSLAYQGRGRALGMERVRTLNQWACGEVYPDLVIWLRIPPDKAIERIQKRGGESRLDSEALSFHHTVFQAFEELAKQEPQTIAVLDALAGPAEVARELFNHPLWQKLWQDPRSDKTTPSGETQ